MKIQITHTKIMVTQKKLPQLDTVASFGDRSDLSWIACNGLYDFMQYSDS